MRIGTRLTLGFLVIAFLLAVFGYAAINISRRALERSIGESTVTLIQATARKIDRSIFDKIELFESFLTRPSFQEFLAASNRDFSQAPNIHDEILLRNNEWRSVPPQERSTLMRQLENNALAQELKKTQDYYEKKYGYRMIGEILVTNRYGALIAQTGRASDYDQSDEAWWQQAVAQNLFVEDVALDESSGIYGISICFGIKDSQGQLAGVIKIILNSQEFGQILEGVKDSLTSGSHKNFRDPPSPPDFELLTQQGRIICSTKENTPLEVSLHWGAFLRDFVRAEVEHRYEIIRSPLFSNRPTLIAYARSEGLGDYHGLGWIVLFSQDIKDLFVPVAQLKDILFVLLIFSVFLSLVIAFFISRSIARPIASLKDVAVKMGEGDLDARVPVASQDEIGVLGDSLNHMAANLKKITASRDELNAEIVLKEKVQKELEQQKNRAQQYLDIAGVMILVLEKNGEIALVNNRACEILGYPREQILGKNWFDHFLPHKVVLHVKSVYNRLMSGETDLFQYHENPVIDKKGEEHIIIWSNAILKDDQGRAVGCLSSGEDVTDRRKTEKVLSVQRDLAISLSSAVDLKEACDSLLGALLKFQGFDSGGVYVLDEVKRKSILVTSRGLTPEFVEKLKFFDFDSFEVQVIKEGKPIYVDHEDPLPFFEQERRKEGLMAGTIIPMMDRGSLVGAFFVASHFLKDINLAQRQALEILASSLGGIIARLKAEERLKESEACFRSIAEQTGQLVYDYDIQAKTVQWSGAIKSVTGYESQEFQSVSCDDWLDHVHPEDKARVSEQLQETMDKAVPYDIEYRFKRKDQSHIFVEEHGIYFSDKEGHAYRMVGTISNINERKEAEEAIRRSEEKYRVLVENANSVILRLDKEGRATFFNEFAQGFFGFREDEVLGRSVVGTIVPAQDDAGRNLEAMISDLCAHPEKYASNENQNICKNGKKVWIAWTNRAIVTDKGEDEVLCVGTDISARVMAEEKLKLMYSDLQAMHQDLKDTQNQLLQSEKMSAIGQLSAGVAHEVKNPLAIIQLSVAALEAKLKDISDENKRHLKMISNAADRANKVIIQLLNFSRYTEVSIKKEPLHPILDNVISLIKTSFKEKAIEFQKEFIAQELFVDVDKILIEQAFFNLIANALDAMEDNGRLTIKTNVIERIDKKKKEVIIAVEDTGSGIPEDIRTRIFEPFFTTKEQGKGTGLGLSMVYTILDRHGGKISFESEIGKGTKFFVGLPLSPGS